MVGLRAGNVVLQDLTPKLFEPTRLSLTWSWRPRSRKSVVLQDLTLMC